MCPFIHFKNNFGTTRTKETRAVTATPPSAGATSCRIDGILGDYKKQHISTPGNFFI